MSRVARAPPVRIARAPHWGDVRPDFVLPGSTDTETQSARLSVSFMRRSWRVIEVIVRRAIGKPNLCGALANGGSFSRST